MRIPGEWSFQGAEVADAFEAHVREQLPWYEWATATVAHICRHYIPRGGLVYDIGASTGNIGRAIADVLQTRGAYLTALESSAEMCARYHGPGKVVECNAANFQFRPYDVAVCFLSLMFLTIEERATVLTRLREARKPGGAIIVVDKLEPGSGYLATVVTRLALSEKLRAGVPADQILAKELSLGGVQRPLSLCELGPDAREVFRFGDFAGWVISGDV